MLKLIVVVVIGAIITITVLGKIDASTTSSSTDTTETSSSSKLTVSITGEVNKTGTYYIATGSTLGDLITSAGGVTSNADEKAYNLDYLVKTGHSYYIAPLYDVSETCSEVPITKVNINTATNDELMTIDGVKSNVATNIISYRTTNGSFKVIEDLTNVNYLGTATFEKMKDYVTLK